MVTKGYNFTVDDIDWSCPADLEPYAKAYNLEQKNTDNMAWLWWGNYGLSAVFVAVEHCLAGKKAMSKYVENPILQKAQSQCMTEEELQKQREAFVANLQAMKANFDLMHPKNKQD